VPTLAKALAVSEDDMMALLQKEYALKTLGSRGKDSPEGMPPGRWDAGRIPRAHHVDPSELLLFNRVVEAYRRSDEQTRKAFRTVCQSILKIPPDSDSVGPNGPV